MQPYLRNSGRGFFLFFPSEAVAGVSVPQLKVVSVRGAARHIGNKIQARVDLELNIRNKASQVGWPAGFLRAE